MIAGPLSAAAMAVLVVLIADNGPEGFQQRYFQLHYDYEVAAQCGLVSGAVERAFRAKRKTGDDSGAMSRDVLRSLRLNAYVAAAREYDNRGLGGHKQWCRTDAEAGVRRILEMIHQ